MKLLEFQCIPMLPVNSNLSVFLSSASRWRPAKKNGNALYARLSRSHRQENKRAPPSLPPSPLHHALQTSIIHTNIRTYIAVN